MRPFFGKGRNRARTTNMPRARAAAPRKELSTVIDCDGRAVEVIARRQPRAKRLILRLPQGEMRAVVSVPPGVALEEGIAFARRRRDWIAKHLAQRGRAVTFAHGVEIPFRGVPHLVLHVPGRRGTVWREEQAGVRRLCVAGAEEHLPRRLADWLKQQARQELLKSCRKYAAAMGARFGRLSVRDQKSRWGSCSSNGTLSFSWRIILAPDFVLDYLAAHEVAHLLEMNHSPRFWRLVDAHCPHWKEAERWLKEHGAGLHLIGAA